MFTGRKINHLIGYMLVSSALLVGLLINISADIIFDKIKNDWFIQSLILLLTFIFFVIIILTYHHKFKKPFGKLLQDFE